MKKAGTASLPLHSGRVPSWLASRMASLGSAIAEVVILHEGQQGFLRRLADPLWFQAFGAVLGMDWHSSGITTSVMGALKRGLADKQHELGLYVCGGRGRHSRKTPEELTTYAEQLNLDADALVRASRLVAKVDNTAIQDGFGIYLHTFVLTQQGDWVVVQQGMNGQSGLARRYHWRSEAIDSFVEEPHDAVFGQNQGKIINLTDRRSKKARQASVGFLEHRPEKIVKEYCQASTERNIHLPAHHQVKSSDLFLRRLHAVLQLARESESSNFEDLLLTRGLGPRTMQALALVSEVACGAPSRFTDPARFAFAHGGKDGHPHPVPLRVYDKSIASLRNALQRAHIGHSEKLKAFRRLESRLRQLEKGATGPALSTIIEDEWQRSPERGGMTVLGPASPAVREQVRQGKPKTARRKKAASKPKPTPPQKGQLQLFG